MAVLFPVFKEISTLFSIVAVLVCIPTNSVRGFPFLHTLSSIYWSTTFYYLFIFACAGSSLLRTGFLQLRWAGASHCGGFSCCGVWALGRKGSVDMVHRLSCPEVCETSILWLGSEPVYSREVFLLIFKPVVKKPLEFKVVSFGVIFCKTYDFNFGPLGNIDEVSYLIPRSEMLFTNENLSLLESESSPILTLNV